MLFFFSLSLVSLSDDFKSTTSTSNVQDIYEWIEKIVQYIKKGMPFEDALNIYDPYNKFNHEEFTQYISTINKDSSLELIFKVFLKKEQFDKFCETVFQWMSLLYEIFYESNKYFGEHYISEINQIMKLIQNNMDFFQSIFDDPIFATYNLKEKFNQLIQLTDNPSQFTLNEAFSILDITIPLFQDILLRAHNLIPTAESIKQLSSKQIFDIIEINDTSLLDSFFEQLQNLATKNIKITTFSDIFSNIPAFNKLFRQQLFSDIKLSEDSFLRFITSFGYGKPDFKELVTNFYSVTDILQKNWNKVSQDLRNIGLSDSKITKFHDNLIYLKTTLSICVHSGIPLKSLTSTFLYNFFNISIIKSMNFMDVISSKLDNFTNGNGNGIDVIFSAFNITHPLITANYTRCLNLIEKIGSGTATIREVYDYIYDVLLLRQFKPDPDKEWNSFWTRLHQFFSNNALFNIIDDIVENGFSHGGLLVGNLTHEAVAIGPALQLFFNIPYPDMESAMIVFSYMIWEAPLTDQILPYFFNISKDEVIGCINDIRSMFDQIDYVLRFASNDPTYLNSISYLRSIKEDFFNQILSSNQAAVTLFGQDQATKFFSALDKIAPLLFLNPSLQEMISQFPPEFTDINASLKNIYTADFSTISLPGILDLIVYSNTTKTEDKPLIDIIGGINKAKIIIQQLEALSGKILEGQAVTFLELLDDLEYDKERLDDLQIIATEGSKMLDPNDSPLSFDTFVEIANLNKTRTQKKFTILAKAFSQPFISFEDLDDLFDDSEFAPTVSTSNPGKPEKKKIWIIVGVSVGVFVVVVITVVVSLVVVKKKKNDPLKSTNLVTIYT